VRLAPGPPVPVRGAGRALWWTSAGLLALGALLLVTLGIDLGDGERIGDRSFTAAADARCDSTDRRVVQPNLDPREGAEEVARIETLADGWEGMVADLRRVPVAEADAPAVDRWLRAWDEWTALGHDYADALAAHDTGRIDRVLHRSEQVNATMTSFARTNGMNRCVFLR
jgi:hypothetical protein